MRPLLFTSRPSLPACSPYTIFTKNVVGETSTRNDLTGYTGYVLTYSDVTVGVAPVLCILLHNALAAAASRHVFVVLQVPRELLEARLVEVGAAVCAEGEGGSNVSAVRPEEPLVRIMLLAIIDFYEKIQMQVGQQRMLRSFC
jgi:hypothetical protein